MNIDFPRYSGVLMHITSLPSKYGIGDFGKEALEFIDNLKETGATLWQLLPFGPTGYGNSPYAARSTFAGNELFISIDKLLENEYITKEDIKNAPQSIESHVSFDSVISFKYPLLKKAASAFLSVNKNSKGFKDFIKREQYWLEDYAMFMVLYNKYNDARWFSHWDEKYSKRDQKALNTLKKEKTEEIYQWYALQYIFTTQWLEVKKYANDKGIKIISDIPIFVGSDSADTWANINLFKTDKNGKYSDVAGVPPDNFSSTGQLWGNPVYNWEEHKKDNFSWWIKRLEKQLDFADILRIDHFKGFDSYYNIPASHKTAEKGKWIKAPGKELFKVLREKHGNLPIIAEDLGSMTNSVIKLRDAYKFPGMKICQFGFSTDKDGNFNPYDTFLPHNYEKNFVAYTGTHDNETTKGWYINLDPMMQHFVREYFSSNDEEIVWNMIKAIMLSHSTFAIFPMQDLLELDNDSRMNTPSTCNDINWSWQMSKKAFSNEIINRFKHLVKISGRNGKLI